MRTIFYLKDYQNQFDFSRVNHELTARNPAYVRSHGTIGSEQWWLSYENGVLDVETLHGKVINAREITEDGDAYFMIDIKTESTVLEMGIPVAVRKGHHIEIDIITVDIDMNTPDDAFQCTLSVRQ